MGKGSGVWTGFGLEGNWGFLFLFFGFWNLGNWEFLEGNLWGFWEKVFVEIFGGNYSEYLEVLVELTLTPKTTNKQTSQFSKIDFELGRD